jgi:hypothetical protein
MGDEGAAAAAAPPAAAAEMGDEGAPGAAAPRGATPSVEGTGEVGGIPLVEGAAGGGWPAGAAGAGAAPRAPAPLGAAAEARRRAGRVTQWIRANRPEGLLTNAARWRAAALVHVAEQPGGAPTESAVRRALGDQPDVSKALRALAGEGLLARAGAGGRASPFSYSITPAGTAALAGARAQLATDAAARRATEAALPEELRRGAGEEAGARAARPRPAPRPRAPRAPRAPRPPPAKRRARPASAAASAAPAAPPPLQAAPIDRGAAAFAPPPPAPPAPSPPRPAARPLPPPAGPAALTRWRVAEAAEDEALVSWCASAEAGAGAADAAAEAEAGDFGAHFPFARLSY